MSANKVFVNAIRDDKTCRACGDRIQGKKGYRFSARYYICEKCYEGGEE
jgi:hypothetical protein